MNTTQPSDYRPSRGDRVGIYIFMAAGLVIIAWSLASAITRIYQILLGEDITASVSLVNTTAQVPVNGSDMFIPMEIDTALVTATHLTPVAFGAAITASALGFLVISTVIVCLLVLARNILRGSVFSRGNTRLVVISGITAMVGFGLIPVFEGVVGFEIAHELADGAFAQSALFGAEPLPFVLLGFVFATIATAFTVGERMQRETEGLV